MIKLRETLNLASSTLKQAGIAHALIGGFALAMHGINRATADIDFLADGTRRDEIVQLLQKAGFKLFHSTAEVLQFSGSGNLDILLANRPMAQAMIESAAQTKFSNGVLVLRPEDLVGLKIQAYKNDANRELQDKADIQKIFFDCANLDWHKIKTYADLFGEWATIEKLRIRK